MRGGKRKDPRTLNCCFGVAPTGDGGKWKGFGTQVHLVISRGGGTAFLGAKKKREKTFGGHQKRGSSFFQPKGIEKSRRTDGISARKEKRSKNKGGGEAPGLASY